MKKIICFAMAALLGACTTEYILMDENGNPVDDGYYTENATNGGTYAENANRSDEDGEFYVENGDDASLAFTGNTQPAEITANDVFPVSEGADFVTYQYRNVRVDEISPLATLYCADVAGGKSSYLREVSMYHNGFMRATFDCVNLAI